MNEDEGSSTGYETRSGSCASSYAAGARSNAANYAALNAAEHPHLIEPAKPEAVLFLRCLRDPIRRQGAKYKRVPRRVCPANFQLSDAQWDSLMVPISMAFFFRSTPDARVVAFYPSPAGATESLFSLETWNELEDANPVLKANGSDVEALLVNRIGHARAYRPSITSCRSMNVTGLSV